MISQRTAKTSLVLNVFLTLASFGLLIYAFLKQTEAERSVQEAIMQRQMAIEQKDMAEMYRQMADSAAMEVIIQEILPWQSGIV